MDLEWIWTNKPKATDSIKWSVFYELDLYVVSGDNDVKTKLYYWNVRRVTGMLCMFVPFTRIIWAHVTRLCQD